MSQKSIANRYWRLETLIDTGTGKLYWYLDRMTVQSRKLYDGGFRKFQLEFEKLASADSYRNFFKKQKREKYK